jgi:uncharacterized membrane protein YoaK (UPF0700 family)
MDPYRRRLKRPDENMLYGNESISTYTRPNVILWMALAFQGGAINAGGWIGFHRFVSHVTGTITLTGISIAEKDRGTLLSLWILPVFFILGAMMSGYLVDSRIKANHRAKYKAVLGWIFALLFVFAAIGSLGYFGPFGSGDVSTPGQLAVSLLCFICGLQNGLITRASKAVVRTTHLTGLATDLGLGFVRLLSGKGIDTREERRATLMRLGILLFFGLGVTSGAACYLRYQFAGFYLPATVAAAIFIASLILSSARSEPAV